MALFQRTDSSSSKPDVTDSLGTREEITALVIEEKDEDLYSMLAGQQLSSDADTKAICGVYARLVMGHENDDNCDKIIDALIREGFSVHATACPLGANRNDVPSRTHTFRSNASGSNTGNDRARRRYSACSTDV